MQNCDNLRTVSRAAFDKACEALWSEIEYQNNLPRRTHSDEANSVPAFCAMGALYSDRTLAAWADEAGTPQVEKALHGLRKTSAIYLRGMIYCGVRSR